MSVSVRTTSAADGIERMDAVTQIQEAWRSLPPDLKAAIQQRGRALWDLRGAYYARFMATVHVLLARDPRAWQQALVRHRQGTVQQLAVLAGQQARLRPRTVPAPPGMSDVQVRAYRHRQQQRGYVPGRRTFRGSRELELELEMAGRAMEAPEPFFTKVTPIPGIGNKEGHEILTRVAMRGLLLSAADRDAIEQGVIRPDRGGRSYWNFPASAVASLKADAQSSHSLRPTPASTTATALRLIQQRFAGLHARALSAASRATALGWVGEALHLLQDSFSAAHVERAKGSGRIMRIHAFYIRVGWPPLSRAPNEHNAPSDPRDDVYSGGAMRQEAKDAISASQEYLLMALRHLLTPGAAGQQAELLTFIRRYLS